MWRHGAPIRRGQPVRAVRFDRYGPPEVLRLAEVERPAPKDDEVLVRVRATTACRSDSGRRSMEYFIGRFFNGFLRPKDGRIGMEFAGEVESAGAAVSELSAGDRVFGIGSGDERGVRLRARGRRDRAHPRRDDVRGGRRGRRRRAQRDLAPAGRRPRARARGSWSTARPARSASAACRSRSTSARTSPPSGARRAWTSCARSAPTR